MSKTEFNEKRIPRKSLSITRRSSISKDTHATPVLATPPEYPEVVDGMGREPMENRPSAPESSYHSEDMQSPQVAYNPLPFAPTQQQHYVSRDVVPLPPAVKHYESSPRPVRYAWHKIRLVLRVLSIIVVLLPVFIVYGWYNSGGQCTVDDWGYYYGYDIKCWRITSVTVVPVVVALNLAELVAIGLNGRGTHPSAQFALDLTMTAGLVAAAIYDFKNWHYAFVKVVPALEIGGAVIHLVCAACDAWAIRVLSWGQETGRGRFPW